MTDGQKTEKQGTFIILIVYYVVGNINEEKMNSLFLLSNILYNRSTPYIFYSVLFTFSDRIFKSNF